SPEQAKGFEADQRSDIFSFGCILFEMLSGRQAFEGETASEILASVLKVEVDLTQLPPRLNPRLVELLKRCLEKNPKKRWHSAADIRVEIESVMGRALVQAETSSRPATGWPTWQIAIAIVVAALAGAYVAWTLRPEAPRSVTRFTIELPKEEVFT